MTFTRLQKLNREDVAPVRGTPTLRDELDHLFQFAFGQPLETALGFDSNRLAQRRAPALDLYENENGLVVTVELPGTKREDIAISLDNGVLTVSGERKQEPQQDGAAICRCERVLGKFERSVTLPYKVDAEKIKATYTDGVLTVTLPKAEEAKLKQIPIEIK